MTRLPLFILCCTAVYCLLAWACDFQSSLSAIPLIPAFGALLIECRETSK